MRLKLLVMSVLGIGATGYILANGFSPGEDRAARWALNYIYYNKAPDRPTRKNISFSFDVKDISSKFFTPKKYLTKDKKVAEGSRRIYRVKYDAKIKINRDCALFDQIPKRLHAMNHRAMLIECFAKGERKKISKLSKAYKKGDVIELKDQELTITLWENLNYESIADPNDYDDPFRAIERFRRYVLKN